MTLLNIPGSTIVPAAGDPVLDLHTAVSLIMRTGFSFVPQTIEP